jgi:hypothetical protein
MITYTTRVESEKAILQAFTDLGYGVVKGKRIKRHPVYNLILKGSPLENTADRPLTMGDCKTLKQWNAAGRKIKPKQHGVKVVVVGRFSYVLFAIQQTEPLKETVEELETRIRARKALKAQKREYERACGELATRLEEQALKEELAEIEEEREAIRQEQFLPVSTFDLPF